MTLAGFAYSFDAAAFLTLRLSVARTDGRDAFEQEWVDRFLRFREKLTGVRWQASPAEVENPVNPRKFDARLEAVEGGYTPIALEITRLFTRLFDQGDSERIIRITDIVFKALRDKDLGGWRIEALPKTVHREQAERFVDKLKAAIIENPSLSEFWDSGFYVTKDDQLTINYFFPPVRPFVFDPVSDLASAIYSISEKKKSQVSVPGHTGVILLAEWQEVRLADVRSACASIYWSHLDGIDQMYLGESDGSISLIFDRAAWDCVMRRELPDDEEGRQLVGFWLTEWLARTVRKERPDPRAESDLLALALEISRRHGQHSMDPKQWDLVRNLATRELERGGWKTPLEFWLYFRGLPPDTFEMSDAESQQTATVCD
ncbi:MAG: hypothetical protein SFV18_09310 [Bryobacteraceae bacterium]|nr:hypothetical protein [Bryobacteraceae bacterium]